MNRINWTRKAVKQLRKIDKAEQPKLYDAAQPSLTCPMSRTSRRSPITSTATGSGVGNYLILFDWDGGVKIVSIEEVRKRDEHTY